MNAPLRQAGRLGRISTELGPDALSLLRFDGSDHLNDLFEYRVEALAARDDLDFDSLIGTHATVEIGGSEGIQQFDGIVTQARWAGVGENGHRYDLTLRPWFWLAGRRRNQRIFHNKTVVQILQELLSDYAQLGDPALKIQLSQDYPVLEYTVQYRESDLGRRRPVPGAGRRAGHRRTGRPYRTELHHHDIRDDEPGRWAILRLLSLPYPRQADFLPRRRGPNCRPQECVSNR